MVTQFRNLAALVFDAFTTAERDDLNAQERMLIFNSTTGQFEVHLNSEWRGLLLLDSEGRITTNHHGVFGGDDLHGGYAQVQVPEHITAAWLLGSGGSIRATPGDPPSGELVGQIQTETGAPTHSASIGVSCWVLPDDDVYINNDGSTGWTKQSKEGHTHTTYATHIIAFSSEDDAPSVGSIVDGFPQGINVGEPGEHGDFTAIRGKATVDDANKGTGTNTLVIEADDNPAFSSAVILFTLPINALGEVDDTSLDNAWEAEDLFIRARWTAVETAPKRTRVQFYFKERVVDF